MSYMQRPVVFPGSGSSITTKNAALVAIFQLFPVFRHRLPQCRLGMDRDHLQTQNRDFLIADVYWRQSGSLDCWAKNSAVVGSLSGVIAVAIVDITKGPEAFALNPLSTVCQKLFWNSNCFFFSRAVSSIGKKSFKSFVPCHWFGSYENVSASRWLMTLQYISANANQDTWRCQPTSFAFGYARFNIFYRTSWLVRIMNWAPLR